MKVKTSKANVFVQSCAVVAVSCCRKVEPVALDGHVVRDAMTTKVCVVVARQFADLTGVCCVHRRSGDCSGAPLVHEDRFLGKDQRNQEHTVDVSLGHFIFEMFRVVRPRDAQRMSEAMTA